MRVLASREVTTREELTIRAHEGLGYRIVMRGGFLVCDDGDETWARAARYLLEAKPSGKSVAWIGGGLCIGPEVFATVGCEQTVYEIEPSLAEFCPPGITFVPGDWETTLRGSYDIIIFDLYDLVGATPTERLGQYLTRGGRIITTDLDRFGNAAVLGYPEVDS